MYDVKVNVSVNKKNIEKIMTMCNKISSAIKEYLEPEDEEVIENERTDFFRQRFNKVN